MEAGIVISGSVIVGIALKFIVDYFWESAKSKTKNQEKVDTEQNQKYKELEKKYDEQEKRFTDFLIKDSEHESKQTTMLEGLKDTMDEVKITLRELNGNMTKHFKLQADIDDHEKRLKRLEK
jgi:uncharacterized membrane-anchored protein YhcB (DUF1043 family)